MLAALEGRLARYKTPKRVIFVDALPRNAMGKVEKAALREAYKGIYGGRGRGPNFSKLFQGNAKRFQGNSKLFQAFSKEFQIYSLAVSNEIKGLPPAPGDFSFLAGSTPELPSRRARARRPPPARAFAEASFLPRFLFSGRKCRAGPAGALCQRKGGRVAE